MNLTASATAPFAVTAMLMPAQPDLAAEPVARDIVDTCGDAPDAGFTDVSDGNVHAPTIDCVKHLAITSGKTASTYDPNGTLRADQLATFVVDTLKAGNVDLPAPTRDHFTDDNGNRHETSINTLAEAGIVDTSSDTYGVAGVPTRAEMSALVVEAAVHASAIDRKTSVPDYFTDDNGTTHEDAINRVSHAGVVTGKGGGRFAPTETLRRDQMATFLARAADLLLDRTTTPPPSGACSGQPTRQVTIASVRADGPGNDVEVRNDSEYVELVNPGTAAVDLSGWKLVDAVDNFIDIPSGFSIPAKGTFRVYSGAGDDVATSRYFASRSQAIWNNSGDTVTLCNSAGGTVDTDTY